MLITTAYRQSTDEYTSVTAQEILKNLEKSPDNIKLMAENGYWGPLLNHLTEGNIQNILENSLLSYFQKHYHLTKED